MTSEDATSRDERVGHGESPAITNADALQKVLLLLVGLGLLICGVVAAFRSVDGVSVAALLASGFALSFVGHLGDRITSVKFRDFEARLERSVQRVEASAAQAVNLLDAAAHRYADIRSGMKRGPERDSERSKALDEETAKARSDPPPLSEVMKLSRSEDADKLLAALGAMRARPELWDFDSMLYAIEHPNRGYDHDRFLQLAADTLHRINEDQRTRLFAVVEQDVRSGKIKQDWVRWLSAVRLLRLMDADWRPAAT